jgi:hypothetical protein
MKKPFLVALVMAAFAPIAGANATNDRVAAMSESGRRTFAALLVRQTGAQCPAATRTFFQGLLEKKDAVWNVSCNSRDNYAIVFYDDAAGTTRVMKCSELKALGAPACFKKL